MFELLNDTLQQALLFLPLAFGVYLSYSILMITDLTVEGTFVLGAAVYARCISLDVNQFASVILALIAGATMGVLVTVMQRVARINSLIAGILATFMLYSVNFGIMQRPNISLLDSNIFLQYLQNDHPFTLLCFLAFSMMSLFILLTIFVRSKTGLHLRAFGSNPHLLKMLGKNPIIYLGLGLSISNMLSALCGVLTAQLNGYADIQMGFGVALTAIGAVVIGDKIMSFFRSKHRRFNVMVGLSGCFVGTYLYFLIVNAVLHLGINPIYLKLLLGLLLLLFLSTAQYTRQRGELYATAP